MSFPAPLTLADAVKLLIELLTRMLAEWIADRANEAAIDVREPVAAGARAAADAGADASDASAAQGAGAAMRHRSPGEDATTAPFGSVGLGESGTDGVARRPVERISGESVEPMRATGRIASRARVSFGGMPTDRNAGDRAAGKRGRRRKIRSLQAALSLALFVTIS